MIAIAVVDENWGLGNDGKLLARLPGDLKHFKEKTLGKTVIMGRKTFESMSGKLLPGRETVILSRDAGFKPGCTVLRSLDEVLGYVKGLPGDGVFVAGGEEIYRLFFPYCGTFFITKLYAAFEADRHFPNLDESPEAFTVKKSGGVMEENGVKYQFFEYTKKNDL